MILFNCITAALMETLRDQSLAPVSCTRLTGRSDPLSSIHRAEPEPGDPPTSLEDNNNYNRPGVIKEIVFQQ